jgi:hypothetical protein
MIKWIKLKWSKELKALTKDKMNQLESHWKIFKVVLNLFSPIFQYIFTYHFLFATLTNSRPILTSKIKLSQQKKCSPTPMPNCLPYEIIFRNWLQLGIGNFWLRYRFQPKFRFRFGLRYALFFGCSIGSDWTEILVFRFRFKIRFQSITNCNTKYSKVWSRVRAAK